MTVDIKNQTEPGDIVQLGPSLSSPLFSNKFLVVEDIKDWGVQGYVGSFDGKAYYRAAWKDIVKLFKEVS